MNSSDEGDTLNVESEDDYDSSNNTNTYTTNEIFYSTDINTSNNTLILKEDLRSVLTNTRYIVL